MNSVVIEQKKDKGIDKIQQLGQHIGNTPLYYFQNLSNNPKVKIFAKLEWMQFGGSVKSRAAFYIIKKAFESGHLGNGRILLDATSGNTGISFASIAAKLNIKTCLVLPENSSNERKLILKSLGTKLVLTPANELIDGSRKMALDIEKAYPGLYFHANQYANKNNWKAHYYGTGREILDQTNYEISHFVTGLGTSGTFTGTCKRLKKEKPTVKCIALQPDSPTHGLIGWKHMDSAMNPEFYDPCQPDEIRTVQTPEAHNMIKHIAKTEGMLLSPSSAANLAGAKKLADEIEQGVIVTILPDTAERYSSMIGEILA